ncbi:MAG: carboxypeptidase regulatory-like domain-containing protein [Planctomycetes bacterium]|nr:carboxypeptidase regulatory-like domain-containing protein [Planctomycetota bacterium]
MRRIQTFVVVLALIAVAALAWRGLQGEGGAPSTPDGAVPLQSHDATPREGIGLPASAAEQGTPDEAEAPSRSTVEHDGLATIRGRCVDEAGLAVADVTITLRPDANDQQLARHRMEHGELAPWIEVPPLRSAADGRFELRFTPIVPYGGELSLRAERRQWAWARWREIEPHAVLELGDVVLGRGVLVTGRVADEDGAPQPGIDIHLQSLSPEPDADERGLRWVGTSSARSDARGAFAMYGFLPPKRYRVIVYGRELLSPAGEVELALPEQRLELVLPRARDEAGSTIHGTVVDPRGGPIAGAAILIGDGEFPETRTRRDGSFVLTRDDRMPRTTLRLGASAEGYATVRQSEELSWGTRGVRIELSEGPPLTIRVVRAADGAPIERFGIRRMPVRERGGISSDDDLLREAGIHDGGILLIPRATPGRFRFAVVPAAATGLPESPEQELLIVSGVPQLVEFRLAALAERVVELVDGQGVPVVGTRVELVWQPSGADVHLEMPVMDVRSARMNSMQHLVVLRDSATSDARGRATLRGHPEQVHALRLPGPGAMPQLVQPFRCDDPSVARVVVNRGAALRGRVEPASLVAELYAEAGIVGATMTGESESLRPGLQLYGVGPRRFVSHPLGSGVTGQIPIETDGSFRASGIPPGTWRVKLLSSRREATQSSGSTQELLTGLTLADGEERELVLDLRALVRSEVELDLRLDGAPFRGGFTLDCELGPDAEGQPQGTSRSGSCDAEGKAVLRLPAGSWRTRLWLVEDRQRVDLPGPSFQVQSNQARTVIAGDLRSARCRLLLLDPDGRALEGVPIAVDRGGRDWPLRTRTTDRKGAVTILGAPGPVVLRIRREPLLDDRAYGAWCSGLGPDREGWLRAWIELGRVELVPGPTEPQTIRLPAEWRAMPR